MARRVTIERILRDNDDMSGQSIREWKMQVDDSHITIRLNHGSGFIMLRPDDIETFVDDLRCAEQEARNAWLKNHLSESST